MTHTPGPWYCHGGTVYKTQYPDVSGPIADMRRDETATKAGIYPVERDENARLIAAAPELAELLRDLVSEGLNVASKSIRDPFRFKLEQARAALAKAGVL